MTKVTFYGHSSFLIESGDDQFLVDPFISPNPKAAHIEIDDLKVGQIFLTHAHQDHVADVEQVAGNNEGCTVISNFEIANYYAKKSISSIGLNHGGIWSNGQFSAKYVPAIHTSSFADGTYGGNPGGWVFKLATGKTIYVAGDTCLTLDMKLIPLLMGPVDLAILPIGGLFTMHMEEALVAAQFVQTSEVIGCHFDTFPPIEIDHEEAKILFRKNDVNLHILEIGGDLEV